MGVQFGLMGKTDPTRERKKTTVAVHQAKNCISLGMRPVCMKILWVDCTVMTLVIRVGGWLG